MHNHVKSNNSQQLKKKFITKVCALQIGFKETVYKSKHTTLKKIILGNSFVGSILKQQNTNANKVECHW